MSSLEAQDLPTPTIEISRPKRILHTMAWITLGIALLLLFTVAKLPEARLKNYIEGSISSVLADQGIAFSARSASLSILFGVSYTFHDVVLTPKAPESSIKIDEIELSPAFLPLLTGKLGGNLVLVQGAGTLKASFAARGNDGSVSFKAKNLDLGRLGVFAHLANLKGSVLLNGKGTLSGDIASPQTLNGEILLDLTKLGLDSQSISGFTLPAIQVSEGNIGVSITNGKAVFNSFKIGKAGDDLLANVSGDIIIAPRLDASTLNLKARFKLSEKINQAIPLLGAILGSSKQSDGFFAYQLTGPAYAPTPTVLTGGK